LPFEGKNRALGSRILLLAVGRGALYQRWVHRQPGRPTVIAASVLDHQEQGSMQRALAAEALGTFWLVFGGCGSAIFAAAFPEVGIGLLGVALALAAC
jgi:hypothetical protein